MKSAEGFTRIELLALFALLPMLLLPLTAMTRQRDPMHVSIDLRNIREMAQAVEEYRTDNDDYMPHPTWGTVPTPPGGWAYATENNGRIPDAPATIPNLSGSFERERQLPFFRIGQLAPYFREEALQCPEDVVERTAEPHRTWYQQRAQKLTPYTWNGAILGRSLLGAGRVEPIRAAHFFPRDIFVWEADETQSFALNDAANNPANGFEGITRRHLSRGTPKTEGAGVIGRFDGSAEMMRWTNFHRLRLEGDVGKPNDLLCGPVWRR